MMLAIRPEYAVAVAGVVSATTLIGVSVESSKTTLRPPTSLTRRRPPESARTPRMLFHVAELFAATAPSWRIGGCCCAPAMAGTRRRRKRRIGLDGERGTVDGWRGTVDRLPSTVDGYGLVMITCMP